MLLALGLQQHGAVYFYGKTLHSLKWQPETNECVSATDSVKMRLRILTSCKNRVKTLYKQEEGTKGGRDKETKGQRDEGTKGQEDENHVTSYSCPLHLLFTSSSPPLHLLFTAQFVQFVYKNIRAIRFSQQFYPKNTAL